MNKVLSYRTEDRHIKPQYDQGATVGLLNEVLVALDKVVKRLNAESDLTYDCMGFLW